MEIRFIAETFRAPQVSKVRKRPVYIYIAMLINDVLHLGKKKKSEN